MAQEERGNIHSEQQVPGQACWKVEAIISIDERGQMIVPKDVREKVGIRAGDRLALATCEQDGEVCCMFLMKAENLSGAVESVVESAIGRSR